MFQSPKGIKDILPDQQPHWQFVEKKIHRIGQLYGYEKLELPVFEETALFQRGVGEGTDIVEKEMYTFKDKSGTSVTLRPEFTAGVVRAYLQHGLSNLPSPVKIWSLGPVFRYERPQAGRFRQHSQFNVEALGEQDPALDFEIMSIAYHLFEDLGFRKIHFQINSIGCPMCRPNYLRALIDYYQPIQAKICRECQKRLKKNPLRLLDCKNPLCRSPIEKAPPSVHFLCKECEIHFETLKTYLDRLKRPYTQNHRLVRGLDYYTKTVFEVWVEGIGAQNAVCGGGRYDGLAEALGGPPTPGVGFASGLERIILTLKEQKVEIPEPVRPNVYFAFQGDDAKNKVVEFLSILRKHNIEAIMGFGSRSLKSQLREANRRNIQFVIILGENEMAQKKVLIKTMEGGVQESVSWDGLIPFFEKRIGSS
ncbi:histidine--tRNA ligase [bacterium]|nr:histidine--tRNA ligase [bacterium]RQV96371.1 MAG: histidine--tRNA ligase [bacterium]